MKASPLGNSFGLGATGERCRTIGIDPAEHVECQNTLMVVTLLNGLGERPLHNVSTVLVSARERHRTKLDLEGGRQPLGPQ